MRASELLDRVGLGETSVDVRFGWLVLLAVCAIYAIGYLVLYPNALTNEDEAAYVRHSHIVLEGRYTVNKLNALTGEATDQEVSKYPIGTALLMAPFVALAGWKGAFIVPFLCLMGGVLILGRWLQQEGRSPLWALLVLGDPTALVMGRVAMSDVPSFFVVTLGLWLFWQGIERGWGYWIASGFLAGISMIWREPNVFIFVPFFAGAVLRREKACWALVVGGVLGVAGRLLSSTVIFGAPFFYKSPYVFDLSKLGERLPTYLVVLLVFVPAGLLMVQFYRGRRWPELIGAVNLFVLVYLFQEYFMWGTSPLKRLILTDRYMLPIGPLMALSAAQVLPRFWRHLVGGMPLPRRKRWEAVAAGVLTLWVCGVAVAAAAVHPVYSAWSTTQANISDAIEAHADPESVLVTNNELTRKFLRELDRKYVPLKLDEVPPDVAADLATRYGSYYVVLLDRDDGPYGVQRLGVYAEFIASIAPLNPTLLFDRQMNETERLRIWRIDRAEQP